MTVTASAAVDAQPAEDERPASFGWRSGIGVNYVHPHLPDYEDPRAVWNATVFGPCSRCTARCRRYGEGGNPLCPDCQGEARAARRGRAV